MQSLVVGSIFLVFGLFMVLALLSPDQLSRMQPSADIALARVFLESDRAGESSVGRRMRRRSRRIPRRFPVSLRVDQEAAPAPPSSVGVSFDGESASELEGCFGPDCDVQVKLVDARGKRHLIALPAIARRRHPHARGLPQHDLAGAAIT